MHFSPPKKVLFLYEFRALVLFSFLHLALSFLGFSLFPVLLFVWGVVAVIYLPLFLRSYRVTITHNHLNLHYGVLIKHNKEINRENIICTTLFRLPDATCLGLCSAVLRGVNTRIFILELLSEEIKCLIK